MSELLEYDELVEVLRMAGASEDNARVAMAEASALIVLQYGRGGLQKAAGAARRPYKTVAEGARMALYYQQLAPDDPLSVGNSVLRELLEEFQDVTWTDLRTAKGADKDPLVALTKLISALAENVSVDAFREQIKHARNPKTFIIDNNRGLRVIINTQVEYDD